MIFDNKDNRAMALAVAEQYGPLAPPLLVGSTFWCGQGKDLDVVVLSDKLDHTAGTPGSASCSEECSMATYRMGEVNVIVVKDEAMWAAWLAADHEVRAMEYPPITRTERVAICVKWRNVYGVKT